MSTITREIASSKGYMPCTARQADAVGGQSEPRTLRCRRSNSAIRSGNSRI